MRFRVYAVIACLMTSPILAETVPALPETAVFKTKTTAKREWAGNILVESHLFIDTVGGATVFWEVYYFKKQSHPVRITFREAYGNELTVWVANGFEE